MKYLNSFESYNQVAMNSGNVKYINKARKYDWAYSPEIKPKPKVDEEVEEDEDKELDEKLMGKFRKSIKINYTLDKSLHAEQRQLRKGQFVSDGDIKELIDRSIDRLSNALMFDEIEVGDKIHLKDSNSDLNIVISLEEDYNNILVQIITLMRHMDFRTDNNTKTIII